MGRRQRLQVLGKLRAKLEPAACFEAAQTHKPVRALWASIVPAEKGAAVEALLVSLHSAADIEKIAASILKWG